MLTSVDVNSAGLSRKLRDKGLFRSERYIQLFIGKYADLFTRKVATLNSLWGVLKG